MEFSFLTPPPFHFGWIVFAFLALYRPTDYVYKIWLSLLQGQGFTFFDPPPHFGRLVFAFLALYRHPDYVYKIWLSLLQGHGFTFFTGGEPDLELQQRDRERERERENEELLYLGRGNRKAEEMSQTRRASQPATLPLIL